MLRLPLESTSTSRLNFWDWFTFGTVAFRFIFAILEFPFPFGSYILAYFFSNCQQKILCTSYEAASFIHLRSLVSYAIIQLPTSNTRMMKGVMMIEQLIYLFVSICIISIGSLSLCAGALLVIRFGAMLTQPDHVIWQCALMITLGVILILGGLLIIA